MAKYEATPFGKAMRELFPFAPTYRNLNHGSYGTFPTAVHEERLRLIAAHEARAEIYKRLNNPVELDAARAAVLPLLGPDVAADEVVLVANATTGVNTVLQNVSAQWSAPSADKGDAVLYLTPIYGACGKTLEYLSQVGRLHAVEVPVTFPADDDASLLRKVSEAYEAATQRGLTVRMALFDTIVSAPGVRLPWEQLVALCRELGIQSAVDGAHGIGQLDLTHLGQVAPDFFVSNLHKWLFVPRGCALLYVPRRNQRQIDTTLPVSWGYEPPANRVYDASLAASVSTRPSVFAAPTTYFVDLFADVGTFDYSNWMCIPEAVRFRNEVCGGEEAIRAYCFELAAKGGARVADLLGTDVMTNGSSNMWATTMVNVRLPLAVGTDFAEAEFAVLNDWLTRYLAATHDTYFRITCYQGHAWVRLSAQVYLDMDDFEWAGQTLKAVMDLVKTGAWRK